MYLYNAFGLFSLSNISSLSSTPSISHPFHKFFPSPVSFGFVSLLGELNWGHLCDRRFGVIHCSMVVSPLGTYWRQSSCSNPPSNQWFSREKGPANLSPVHKWLLIGTALCSPNAGTSICCESVCSGCNTLKTAFHSPLHYYTGLPFLLLTRLCPLTFRKTGINVLYRPECSVIIYSLYLEQLQVFAFFWNLLPTIHCL